MPAADEQREAMLWAVLAGDTEAQSRLLMGSLPPTPPRPPLSGGGGGGTYDPMNERVTKLETHMEYVRRDLDSIGGKLDVLLDRTNNLPTKGDLTTFRWQWIATAVAAIALIVGGIIGGLGWIKPDAEPAKPTVIQLSPPPVVGNAGI